MGEKADINQAFEKIIGTPAPQKFGEPFFTAFSRLYNGSKEEITAAAYTCALFLSVILEEYPTAKLHTFVHHVQENYTRFSFNCKMYDSIFNEMNEEMLTAVALLKADNHSTTRECNKEDIFEALDFYTNR